MRSASFLGNQSWWLVHSFSHRIHPVSSLVWVRVPGGLWRSWAPVGTVPHASAAPVL